jgi:hypothetical protein
VVVVVVEGGLPDRTLATASSGEKVTCKSSDRGKATCSVDTERSARLWPLMNKRLRHQEKY